MGTCPPRSYYPGSKGYGADIIIFPTDMQKVYEQEVARQALLNDAQRRSEGIDATDVVRLPLVGRRLRLLFFGGGGCGKTRIINYALAKLFRRFYGPKGWSSMPLPTNLLD